jgi:hypothetical protein
MSFIATEPGHTPRPADASVAPERRATIVNDGWFPDIDLSALRDAMRLDGTVTHERLVDAVTGAIADVNAQLGTWQATQLSAGFGSLGDVPSPVIDGQSVRLTRYRSAVYRLAKADLTARYRDYDSTKSGAARAEELETTIDDDRRAAHWAINDITGRRRTTVELI